MRSCPGVLVSGSVLSCPMYPIVSMWDLGSGLKDASGSAAYQGPVNFTGTTENLGPGQPAGLCRKCTQQTNYQGLKSDLDLEIQ